MVAGIFVASALLAASAAQGASNELSRVNADGSREPFLLWQDVGHGDVALRWPDTGAEVEFRPIGNIWTCDIDPDLGVPPDQPLQVAVGGQTFTMSPVLLSVGRAPDGRWVLLADDLATAVAPPAPHSIRVGTPSPAMDGLATLDRLANTPRGVSGAKGGEMPDDERELVGDPAVESAVLERLLQDDNGLRFLRDVNFRFRTFDHDGESSLGASYGYDKSRPFWTDDHSDDKGVSGGSFDISLEGNIAFEDEVNPADFLSSRITLDYFRSRGGTSGPLSLEQQQRAVALATEASNIEDRDEWLASDAWRELQGLARGLFTTQYYWEIGLDLAYESDQSFDAQNLAYGAHFALDVKAWNDESELATLNLFDWPAALVRYLTGFDSDLTPRGSSIPTLLVALERVEPGGDTPRADVGDTSDYTRARGELVYKAPLGIVGGEQYSLTALLRGYAELDPSDEVEDADLDRFHYATLAIETEVGLFASFSSGQLPFDDEDAEVYALGWSFNFQ